MIKQSGCLAEELLRCIDSVGKYTCHSKWDTQDSMDRFRESAVREEIRNRSCGLQGGLPVVSRCEGR